MTSRPGETYELFLALAPPRIEAARTALAQEDLATREAELAAVLLPLAVDAALLGADGVSQLARAAARAAHAPVDAVTTALDRLAAAVDALGHGDASGARVDEEALRREADALRSLAERGPRPLPPTPRPPSSTGAAAAGSARRVAGLSAASTGAAEEDPSEVEWTTGLADDMVAAFLDECVERLDGLAERLLRLEQHADDRELVNEVFRDLHTLKGSSAFAGLRKMNRVAHLAEDRIGELRDGKRACDRALIDVLLEALDVLRAIVERARARAPIDVDVRDLVARLRDPGAARAPARPSEPSPPGKPADATVRVDGAGQAATLRIDFAKVDLLMNLVGESVLARGRLAAGVELQASLLRELAQLRQRAGNGAPVPRGSPAAALPEELQRFERVFRETHEDLDSGVGSLTLAVGQLRDQVMRLRMVPIARLFTKYQRTVRELSNKLKKEVKVELLGAETELDKVLVERLEDPLLHLVRNAVDHGVEPPAAREAAGKPRLAQVLLSAAQRGGQILVTIQDDGAGMDPERLRRKAIEKRLVTEEEGLALSREECLNLIFRPGFSTAAEVSDVSGRGVGMDVVRDTVQKLKGTIHVDSLPGRGTTVELRLPLTLAITQVLAARVASELVAIPLDAVVSAQRAPESLELVADGTCLRQGERLIPVIDLASLLGLEREAGIGELQDASIVVVDVGTDRLGLLVAQVLGRHDVVIKSLGPLLASAPCASGATLIGDKVLLVVDLLDVAARARQPSAARVLAPKRRPPSSTGARVLIAEDSDVIRETIRRALLEAGFEVSAAKDGREALELARAGRFDAICTDVVMPNMDGYELTRALRADARYAGVPIVMVTSKDLRIDALRGYDSGADAYLTKPSEPEQLIRTIDGLLRRGRGTAAERD